MFQSRFGKIGEFGWWECTITELKNKEHKEPSVTQKVTGYFNIFECERNIVDQLDVTYQLSFMATPKDKYYTEMLENLIKVNNCEGEPLSNEIHRKAVTNVREEMEAEQERNINNITCDDS